jgi:hypothetical protein
MAEYTTTIPIPEPIKPRELLDDPVEEKAIEVTPVGDPPTHVLATHKRRLIAVVKVDGEGDDARKKAESKVRKEAKRYVGEYPPMVDKAGNVLEVDMGDVFKLASRRPWLGRNPALATLMIEVFREYRDAEREGRAMQLTKEQVDAAKVALTKEADPKIGDEYLAGAFGPVVVSQVYEGLVQRFVQLAEDGGEDAEAKALPAPAPEAKSNGKSNGAAAPKKKAPKRKSGRKGRSRKRA